MMLEKRKANLGYILAITSACLYALQVVVGKIIIKMGVGAEDLLIFQYTGAACILFLFLFLRRHKVGMKPDRRFIKPVLIQGIFGCAGTSFFFYRALEHIDAGISSMLLYLCPVYVCLFFVITGIRRISLFNKIAVVMAFGGALCVLNIFQFSGMKWSGIGLALGFLSGICYAFYGIYADLKLKKMPVEQMLFYMYLTATIVFWVTNPGMITNPPEIVGFKLWVLIMFLMLLQVTPMALLNLAIRMIGSNKATVIATAELPCTIVFAFLLLGEMMNFIQAAGICLIVGAILLLNLKKEEDS